MSGLTATIRKQLEHVSVATITTALFKRGFRNQLIQGVYPVGPGKNKRMIGPAFTLRSKGEPVTGGTVNQDGALPGKI